MIQLSLKCYILGRDRAMKERNSCLISVTFDLEHEMWPVSYEPYFNLAVNRWSARFLLRLYENISSP